MSQERAQTLTGDLLNSVRSSIVRNASTFAGLEPVSAKVGFLGTPTTFPAVSIIPVNWNLVKFQSGRRYVSQRTIEVRFYSSAIEIAEAQVRVKKNIEKFRTLLQNEDRQFFFKSAEQVPSSFSFSWDGVQYTDVPARQGERGIAEAVVQISLLSREYRPAQKTKPTTAIPTDSIDGFSVLWQRLRNNKDGRLKAIKIFSKEDNKDAPDGMSLCVYEDNSTNERYSQGDDREAHNFVISLKSMRLPDSKSLIDNANMADTIRDIIDEDETFGGRFFDSFVPAIVYGQGESADKTAYYQTDINFVAQDLRSTNFVIN